LLQDILSKEFENAVNELNDDELKMLLELISRDYRDIKIAITKGAGMYHDKLGIIDDTEGNGVAVDDAHDGLAQLLAHRPARHLADGPEGHVVDKDNIQIGLAPGDGFVQHPGHDPIDQPGLQALGVV